MFSIIIVASTLMHLKTKGMGEAFKKKTTHVLIIFAVVGKASSSTHILFISL